MKKLSHKMMSWAETSGKKNTLVGYLGQTALRRKQCDRIDHLLRNASINILKVTQSTARPRLLSSQCFRKHVFVTRNNLHK
jgi:hypothetical protein